nr:ABC transporter permease [uncultured bacterium]
MGASLLAMTASPAAQLSDFAKPMKQKKAQWPWHVLTVLLLIGLAGALYYATSLMS